MKIALAVRENLISENEYTDDHLLKSALEDLGVEVDIINWRDKSIDLKQYDSIIVESTWDCHKYPQEFLAWIEACDSDRKKLINSAEFLRLGINKDEYLKLLLSKFGFIDSEHGSIIPSLFIKDKHVSFTTKIAKLKADHPTTWGGDIIIKPIISAGGDYAYRFTTNEELIRKNSKHFKPFSEADKIMEKLMARKYSRGVIIQPFIPSVEEIGEYQLVFIGGKFTHATVKPKGFRNNDASQRLPIEPKDFPQGMDEFAKRITQHLQEIYPEGLTRLRLDFFAGIDGPILSEAEMVEPNTNIRRLNDSQKQVVIKKYAAEIFSRTEQLKAQAQLKEILGNQSERYIYLTKNQKFCKIILKLHDTKNSILAMLANEPTLNNKAKIAFPNYFKKCIDAICTYETTKQDPSTLLKSLNAAIKDFSPDILAFGKNSILETLNSIIKFVVELFTRKPVKNLFFAGTSPKDKLEATNQDLNLTEEIPPTRKS